MSWAQFLKLHWEMLAATDFFTVEVGDVARARDVLTNGVRLLHTSQLCWYFTN